LSRRWLVLPLLLLYLLNLGGAGLLGPDEPRYASIGRAMARTGDWVTPRLNGQPWFEKPPLTYWLTGTGTLLGLPDEWAARLPNAILSVAFLVFFYLWLAREFSPGIALTATAILATSTGWLAYSFAGLTDLPMSVALAAAMMLATGTPKTRLDAILAGAFLGLSVLAKGFVPVVLFAPFFLLARRRRLGILAGSVLIAAPWFILCYARNGAAFWDDFFWKQHVSRFFTPELEHVQPFWYYVPVLLGGLFPWTPLFGLIARRKLYDDARIRFLALWIAYGFVFFSTAKNKLPGYLLPLMPAVAIVLAAALKHAPAKRWWMALCAALLIALPTAAAILPEALLVGLSRTHIAFAPAGIVFASVSAAAWWIANRHRAELAVTVVALATAAGIVYFKYRTLPALDSTVSVRSFWRENRLAASSACVDQVNRAWQYGLEYYAGHALPQCGPGDAPRIVVRQRRLALAPR
jgi:4-amino-4-deoxy-L-arabinose transferase-like glycosyltransferase